ncbi:MAG: gamma carbonic anhydrase family protein [Desulfarculus sp.]|nr:MAG: gamma carbonic anhydrase family protein [Desulfarculus sp.]
MASYEFEGQRPRVDAAAYVHPQAVLIGQVDIAAHCFIGAGAVLRADFGPISIGQGSNVQENCALHQNAGGAVEVGREVIIGHGAILHDCLIADKAFVGMGAVVLAGCRLEEGAMLAAGAVAPEGLLVPAGRLAAGNPARVVKQINPELAARIAHGRALYQGLAARCQAGLRRLD